jgi:hypothetical protein
VSDITPQDNALSRADIIKLAEAAGNDTAAGTDALPKHVVLAAPQREVTLDRHRDARDDATAIYATYANACERGAKLDGGNKGIDASRRPQVSKLRQLIKMGTSPDNPVQEKASFYQQLRCYGAVRGYRDGWAKHKFKEKFGHRPNGLEWLPPIDPTPATPKEAERQRW